MHYFKFNIPDWHLATSHLTPEEEGIYLRLIKHYYDTESPIPTETQSVIRRLRLGSNSETVGVILAEFFTLEADGWHNKRCDREIEEYHLKAEKNRDNGKKGGRPPKAGPVDQGQKPNGFPDGSHPVYEHNPDETLTINQEPLTNNKEKKRDKRVSLSPGDLPQIPEALAIEFLAYRKTTIKAPLTERAWSFIVKEAGKAGWTVPKAVEHTMAKSWRSFEAAWVNNNGGRSENNRDFDNSAPAKVERAIAARNARRQAESPGASDGTVIEGEFERSPF